MAQSDSKNIKCSAFGYKEIGKLKDGFMNKSDKIREVRQNLHQGNTSIGSWMQISSGAVAEIMGDAGYDWIALDLEHGAFSLEKLPDIFRALELGGCLPLVRIAQQSAKDCKHALDCGAAGVIVPNIKSASQLQKIRNNIAWPPSGTRGVGFSRANLYGKNFLKYQEEAQSPLLIAMIEDAEAISNLTEILGVEGLDAILIGPYDLSASLGLTGDFNNTHFLSAIDTVRVKCIENSVPMGVHVVDPKPTDLREKIKDGYQFIAYGIDSVFLNESSMCPSLEINK